MRILVTGASRGIGRATAIRLAGRGDEVWIHHRSDGPEIEDVAAAVRDRGATPRTVRADLAEPADWSAVARAVAEAGDRLDVLVHNAGSYPRTPLRDLTPELVQRQFNQHVFGPLEITRQLAGHLARADPGRVVFVSSVLAYQGSEHGAHYAAAKAAVLGLTRSLARELAPSVRVNAVAPGAIDTAILAGDSPGQRADRERRIPLGRVGTPEEVAEAIAFLAAREGYCTGTTVHVNGGARTD